MCAGAGSWETIGRQLSDVSARNSKRTQMPIGRVVGQGMRCHKLRS